MAHGSVALAEPPCLHAFLGNPPFMGGSQVSGTLGGSYRDWLLRNHDGSHGNADYCAHFFRRAFDLFGVRGAFGQIATNTISQGDTRATGLQYLTDHSALIFDATRSMLWPGAAAVAVSVVHVAVGAVREGIVARLDGTSVVNINSQLDAGAERALPARLESNGSRSFLGSKTYGQGFILTPEERDALVKKNPRNAERIFPYLGGEEVNTSPTQNFDRYVISFGAMSLEEAERWPDLIAIIRANVKPERDKNNRDGYRKYWWHFGEKRPGLYSAISPLRRCLVTAQVTKHLCFSFQPVGRVYSQKLYVFPFDDHARFGTLQSRIHEAWTRLLSSTMKNDLNYSASDCFETFPFPRDEALATTSTVERAGEALYTARAKYMVDENVGLTITYNRLKDPTCDDPRIVALRRLHEAMDRAVLDAYGWTDLEVPPYGTPVTADGERAAKRFEDEVIDRLFALNAERAAEEKRGEHVPPPSESTTRLVPARGKGPGPHKTTPSDAPPGEGEATRGGRGKKAAS
jgi:hypothetical protein